MFVASEMTLKQSRKLIIGIITSSTTHEPITYLNSFHLYAHNVLMTSSNNIFGVSSFLKWAGRGGQFRSATSEKNCAID